jgi:hypothetical protein
VEEDGPNDAAFASSSSSIVGGGLALLYRRMATLSCAPTYRGTPAGAWLAHLAGGAGSLDGTHRTRPRSKRKSDGLGSLRQENEPSVKVDAPVPARTTSCWGCARRGPSRWCDKAGGHVHVVSLLHSPMITPCTLKVDSARPSRRVIHQHLLHPRPRAERWRTVGACWLLRPGRRGRVSVTDC